MNRELELLVTKGPLTGRRFNVPAEGLRLGRSSGCEISLPDLALSRSHCLFELRDGGLWVTDLASANGTFVNDEQLGTESRRLQSEDRIIVGDTVIRVVAPGKDAVAPNPASASASELPKIDLGLGRGEQPSAEETPTAAWVPWLRLALWGLALVSVLGALALIFQPVTPAPEAQEKPVSDDEGDLVSFTFEKVVGNTGGLFRCAYAYKDGLLSANIDELSEVERHVPRKTEELGDDKRKRLSEILSASRLREFAPDYTGTPSEPGTMRGFRLHVVRSTRVFDVSIENSVVPQSFQDVCGRLDEFMKSTLKLWAMQSTVKELLEKSADARRVADERWGERGATNYEKYDEALKKYKEALNYLETVNPKPAHYEELRAQRKRVEEEIVRVYKQLCGNVEQAFGTQNWEQARIELQNVLMLVPDVNDERNREARNRLLQVDTQTNPRR